MASQIILVDDHQLIRDGIRALIERAGERYVIVGEANNGREALDVARRTRPNIAVIDLQMPGLRGVELVRRLRLQNPGLKVIVLSMHSDENAVTEMLNAGIDGYVTKRSALEHLYEALEAVSKNRVYLVPEIQEKIVRAAHTNRRGNPTSGFHSLTSREKDVLRLLADGNSTAQIAVELCISTKTVEAHRLNLKQKLGIHNIAELTKLAIRENLSTI